MIFVYLSLTLLTAVLGAFTDIHAGRVKNKHLIVALIIWLALVICESIFKHSLVIPTYPFTLNAGLAFITATIFYLADIWAPGDCKLYIIMAIIFPMNAYVIRDGNIFPALDFVIYAFALGYVALLTIIIIQQMSGKKSKSTGNAIKINFKHSFSIIASIGMISAIYTMLDIYATDFFYANRMLCTVSVIGIICLLQKRMDKVRQIVGLIGLIFSLIQCIAYNSWFNAFLGLIVSFVIAIIIEVINSRAYVNAYREISHDEVRPGMILSFSTLWAMQKCIDPELPQTTTENRRSRLTIRQAEAVRTWCKNAKRNIIIVEMIPFAPFIASAVLVQVLRFLCLGR